jgi:hypothetical protein
MIPSLCNCLSKHSPVRFFTSFQRLTVVRNDFAPPGSAPNVNDWASTLPEFRAQLIANVRAGSVDAALPEFSTSDAITSAAFTCSLMRALQNFFQFVPQITNHKNMKPIL